MSFQGNKNVQNLHLLIIPVIQLIKIKWSITKFNPLKITHTGRQKNFYLYSLAED